MANVVTDEKPAPDLEPPNAPNIRAAILAYIPEDANIQRDIRIHDGIADVSIKWRTLRWQICLAVGDQTPDQIGKSAAESFRAWVVSTLNNINNTPRHARVLREIELWLLDQNDGVWGDVIRLRQHDGSMKWLIEGNAPVTTKTEFRSDAGQV